MTASPFGKASRVQILRQHLAESISLIPDTAWKFIYRELLWIDGSTGLAHLYESDKAQPGRPWYNRTVTFNKLLCEQFGNVSQEELKLQIDRLFRTCLEKLIKEKANGKSSGKGKRKSKSGNQITEVLTSAKPSQLMMEATVQAVAQQEETVGEAEYIPDTELVTEFASILSNELKLA